MTIWKYFGQHSGCGPIYRVFRCPNDAIELWDQPLIERAFPNGVWKEDSQAERVLMNEHLQGWFSPKDEELSEEDALALLADWDKNGWPDLPGRY